MSLLSQTLITTEAAARAVVKVVPSCTLCLVG